MKDYLSSCCCYIWYSPFLSDEKSTQICTIDDALISMWMCYKLKSYVVALHDRWIQIMVYLPTVISQFVAMMIIEKLM